MLLAWTFKQLGVRRVRACDNIATPIHARWYWCGRVHPSSVPQVAAAGRDVPDFVRGNITLEPELDTPATELDTPMPAFQTSQVDEGTSVYSWKVRIRNQTDGEIAVLGIAYPDSGHSVLKRVKLDAMVTAGAGKGSVEVEMDRVKSELPRFMLQQYIGSDNTYQFKIPKGAAAVYLWVYPRDEPNMIYGTMYATCGSIGTVKPPAGPCRGENTFDEAGKLKHT